MCRAPTLGAKLAVRHPLCPDLPAWVSTVEYGGVRFTRVEVAADVGGEGFDPEFYRGELDGHEAAGRYWSDIFGPECSP